MGEAASVACPERISSVTVTVADFIYGSGDCCLEGNGALPGFLIEVIVCHGSFMAFSLI